ncbi:Transcriptional regulator, LysR family [Xenorhabdus poinarii G6]|uniref:Transcriptional regulator, LysR family n=1 Tax=Xenorhabdus poinarii G6 TaxID=1354304 RepID=A0A068R4N2_9GAMM|nr:LysR family transcriptional regulator [Xenorhabdus poinarii]CDG21999.1 Transcriptional regulator, LysR family [Xenorhabdus poinarii G6]
MAPNDPFRYIIVFLYVTEAGSFTLAAERLGMSKSGVAKSIARLENSLGVRLFNRTTRRLSLTDEGKAYSQGCSRILSDIQDMQAEISTRKITPSGRLRVDLPVVFGKRWVLPILFKVMNDYPTLELDISLNDRRVDLIDDGIDLAIRIGALDESATLVAKSLGIQKAVVCASPSYLKKYGSPNIIDDLHNHLCINFGNNNQNLPWKFFDKNNKKHNIKVPGVISLNNSEAILDAALNGYGIAMLADWLVYNQLQSGQLIKLLPDIKTQGFPIHAIWPKNKLLSSKVRVVIDALSDSFIPLAPWEVTDNE